MKQHRFYKKFESLLILFRFWKKLNIDFVTNLFPIIYNAKEINAILIIIDKLIKFMQFWSISKTIIVAEIAKLIYEKVMYQYRYFWSIMSD